MKKNDADCFLTLLAHHLDGNPWKIISFETIISTSPYFESLIDRLKANNYVRYQESKHHISITLKGFYYAYELTKSSNSPEYFGLLPYDELKDLSFSLLDIIREKEQKEGYFSASVLLRDYGEQIPKQSLDLLEEEGYIIVINRTKVNTTPKGIARIIQSQEFK